MYLVFVVAGELYSQGTWMQLRHPQPTTPFTLPHGARYVAALSSSFEKSSPAVYRLESSYGTSAQATTCGAATSPGWSGLRVTINAAGSGAMLQSEGVQLQAGKECHVQLWVRSPGGDVRNVTLRAMQGP